VEIDLLSITGYGGSQPNDQFAWLRENAPAYRHPEPDGPGFWAITRYDDVKAVGRDHDTFSSQPTILIPDGSDEPSPFDDHTMMLVADPPLHTRMRRLVSREFTPRAANALRPRIQQLAVAIIDRIADQGECDLVADIAGEMPSLVIAEMLGISHDEGRRLYHCTETIHASTEVVSRKEQRDAIMAMFISSQTAHAEKLANPTEDLGSLIAHGAIDGERIDAIDFFLWFMLLVDAGGDTTRNLVGGGLQALFEHPDQLALLRSDIDAYLGSAIEEMLRWVSPVVYMRRTATTDTELAGQAIAAGDKVVMYYGAANRDSDVFDEPERFDIARSPNPHVSFGGGGPHYCLGANLARLEIEAILREILTRLPDLEPAGPVEWMSSNFVFGPSRMPVRFTP
jgi:cytochrome P450